MTIRRPRRRLLLTGLAVLGLAGLAAACVPQPLPPPAVLEVATTPEFFPAFDPAVTDYVAPCGDGAPITVSAAVPDGGQVSIDGQGWKPGRFWTTTSRTEGQAFTVAYQAPPGQVSRTYHIRCLPPDFPESSSIRGVAKTAQWFVTTPWKFGLPPPPARSIIYDAHGVPVWWGPLQQTYYTTWNAAGNLVTGFGDGIEERSLDGTLVRDVPIASLDPHDWVQLSNGHFVVVVNVHVPNVDLTGIGGPADGTLLNQVVQEIDPADPSNPVWTWDVGAHIAIDEMADQFRPTTPPIGGVYDVYHWNSIEPMGDGTYLLSFRHLDALYKIDPKGGIVWKLSGQGDPLTGAHLTIVGDPVLSTPDPHFGGQHDARRLPGGSATSYDITLHDNRTHLTGSPRAVRYTIDETQGTATFVMAATDAAVPASVCCGSARWADPGDTASAPGDWVVAFGGTGVAGELLGGTRTFSLEQAPPWVYYRVIPVPSGTFTIGQLRSGMEAMWASGAATALEATDHPVVSLP